VRPHSRPFRWWLANKSPQRLLVMLTESEFAWADDAGGSAGARAALPPSLRGVFIEQLRGHLVMPDTRRRGHHHGQQKT
jgi:hypothetical protein